MSLPTDPPKQPPIRDNVVDARFLDILNSPLQSYLQFIHITRGQPSPNIQLLTHISLEHVVDVTARAIEVLGNKQKAMRWLKTPVPSLGGATPLSLLDTDEGIARVEDALGRIEQGVW